MSEENIENNEILLNKLSSLISKALTKLNENKLEIDSLNQVNKSLEEFAAKESTSKLELIEENDELKARLENLAGNNSYYTDLVKSLELNIEQNAHYKIEYEHVREKYEKMLLENAELKEQVNTIPSLNNKIEEQNFTINEIDLLNKSYLNTIGKYEKALIDKELIQKDLASKNIRIYELLNEIESYKEKVTISESQLLKTKDNEKIIPMLQKQLAQLESESSTKFNEINEVNYQLSVENAQLKDDLNNSKIEIGNVENEKAILENKNQELNQFILNLQNETIDLKNQISELHGNIEQLNIEIIRLNKINQSYIKEHELIKSNNEINNKELKIAQDEINNLNTYNEELIIEIERLERINNENKNELTTLQDQHKKLNNMLDEVKSENSNIKNSIERYQIEIDNLKSEVNSAGNERIIEYSNKIDELERLNTDLQFRLEESQNELSQKSKDVKMLQDRLSDFINEANELKSDLAEQNVKLSIYSNNESKNLTRINSLEELVKTRYEQINLLESKINTLLEEKNTIKNNKMALIEIVKTTIKEIDNEINSLKSK